MSFSNKQNIISQIKNISKNNELRSIDQRYPIVVVLLEYLKDIFMAFINRLGNSRFDQSNFRVHFQSFGPYLSNSGINFGLGILNLLLDCLHKLYKHSLVVCTQRRSVATKCCPCFKLQFQQRLTMLGSASSEKHHPLPDDL